MAVSAGRRMARAAAAAGLAAMLLVEGVAARKHMNEFKRMPGHKQLEQVKSPRVRTVICLVLSRYAENCRHVTLVLSWCLASYTPMRPAAPVPDR